MSDEKPIVDATLPPAVEAIIQGRSLGLIQAEFGALQTNFFMMQARVEALMQMRTADLEMIDSLRIRALRAEDNVRILQGQWRDAQDVVENLEKKINRKPRRGRVT